MFRILQNLFISEHFDPTHPTTVNFSKRALSCTLQPGTVNELNMFFFFSNVPSLEIITGQHLYAEIISLTHYTVTNDTHSEAYKNSAL